MKRNSFLSKIDQCFQVNPVVAILGPRQCGKTTLARDYITNTEGAIDRQNYFDLESLVDLERLTTPELTLSALHGLVMIDEIQKIPALFNTLRVLVDRHDNKTKFLILGSASRELLKQTSETLAGRISYIELTPFNYEETNELDNLWLRGGFPRSYLSRNMEISNQWRQDYIRTFLEQDIPNLGIQIVPANLRRFWMMVTHYHGNIFNASELGQSLGISHNTAKNYLDILTGTFMIRQLSPWFENIKKRQVKSPKMYFRDSGIFHTLLGVETKKDLLIHPKLGASWEGFALEEIIRHLGVPYNDCYFWSTYGQAELDLLVIKNNKRIGFEIKYTDRPRLTRSVKIFLETLNLDSLYIIYPGEVRFKIAEGVEACGLTEFLKDN